MFVYGHGMHSRYRRAPPQLAAGLPVDGNRRRVTHVSAGMTRAHGGPTARRLALAAVALAVAVVFVGGCSGANNRDDASSSDEAGRSGAMDLGDEGDLDQASEEAGAPAADGATGAGGDAAIDTVALVRDREVIRTGSMQLSVDEVGDALAEVRRLTDEAAGFVADERELARESQVTITVRVPTDAFDEVRELVAELGDVVEQTVEAKDVTAEVVDVETRIESLRKSVERLQGMLGQSGDVAQLAAVEGELSRREVELEALLGQQRVLQDQVSLGTLTVTLSEDEAPVPDDDAAGFGDGWRQGWVTFVDVGRAGLAALGFLLPFVVPALVIGVPARWWLLRQRRSDASPPAPTPAATGSEA